jgi:hypothetical protein
VCVVLGCVRPVFTFGYCRTHYRLLGQAHQTGSATNAPDKVGSQSCWQTSHVASRNRCSTCPLFSTVSRQYIGGVRRGFEVAPSTVILVRNFDWKRSDILPNHKSKVGGTTLSGLNLALCNRSNPAVVVRVKRQRNQK